ncbi:hypothetical protein [Streptomyces sp. wa1063]|uniref:hypothetical protein n=1 Tax=Streptomyces sp. wa1063 TaxID=1828212 RepID=UPI000BF19FA9|nr:hypothetical protein [Streptomyces sp. wa1063]
MTGTVGIGRRGVLAAGALAAVAACAPASRKADSEKGRKEEDNGQGGEKDKVRTDPVPLERRFTLLGPLSDVHWLGISLGDDSRTSAPGPIDVRVVGVAQLEAGTGAAVVAVPQRDFRPRQPDRVPAKLAAFLPKGAAWVRSEAFNQEVTGGRYTGEFYVNVGADRVYFDTVDPSVPASTGP